jgi:Transposase DDE domain
VASVDPCATPVWCAFSADEAARSQLPSNRSVSKPRGQWCTRLGPDCLGYDAAGDLPSLSEVGVVPFKANAERRHHIPKQRHRIQNSTGCDAALRQRGCLTVCLTDAAIAAGKAKPRTTRGGQPRYSGLAIAAALTLRSLFRLAPWQAEGLIGSIIARSASILRCRTTPPCRPGPRHWKCSVRDQALVPCTWWWTARG